MNQYVVEFAGISRMRVSQENWWPLLEIGKLSVRARSCCGILNIWMVAVRVKDKSIANVVGQNWRLDRISTCLWKVGNQFN